MLFLSILSKTTQSHFNTLWTTSRCRTFFFKLFFSWCLLDLESYDQRSKLTTSTQMRRFDAGIFSRVSLTKCTKSIHHVCLVSPVSGLHCRTGHWRKCGESLESSFTAEEVPPDRVCRAYRQMAKAGCFEICSGLYCSCWDAAQSYLLLTGEQVIHPASCLSTPSFFLCFNLTHFLFYITSVPTGRIFSSRLGEKKYKKGERILEIKK